MRQGISGFFLLMILFSQWGNPLLVTIRTVQIAHKMRSELRMAAEASMVTLAFSQDEFERLAHSRDELLVNGRLFDIASRASRNNLIVVRGVYDDEETDLLNLLKDLYTKLANDKSLRFSFVALIFIPSPAFALPDRDADPPAETSFLPFISQVASDLTTPPPRAPLTA